MDAADQPQTNSAPIAYDDQTGLPVDSAPREDAMMPVPGADTIQAHDRGDQLSQRVSDVAQRLKPVAVVAENAAGKAVDLSARGLARLSEYLERRRQDRHHRSEITSTDD